MACHCRLNDICIDVLQQVYSTAARSRIEVLDPFQGEFFPYPAARDIYLGGDVRESLRHARERALAPPCTDAAGFLLANLALKSSSAARLLLLRCLSLLQTMTAGWVFSDTVCLPTQDLHPAFLKHAWENAQHVCLPFYAPYVRRAWSL